MTMRATVTALIAGFMTLALIACSPKVSGVESEKSSGRKLNSIGVQLYTVRNEMEKDFEGTLRKIAALGYDEVEFAGLFGREPQDVKALLDELGLNVAASHVNWKRLRDEPEELIAETRALGANTMIIAWFPEEERQTLEQWQTWIAHFNKVAEMAHEQGIGFAYHNHEFEFEAIDGVEPYDLLLETIDRRYVSMELDLYWLALAGRSPDAYFDRYPGGFIFSHVKDMSAEDNSMVDVGDGIIDFAEIFALSEKSGMKHFIVEHDASDDPFATLERSIAYLRNLEY